MGSAIIVAAITYGAGLLMLLIAVEAVVCVGLMVKQKWKANEKILTISSFLLLLFLAIQLS